MPGFDVVLAELSEDPISVDRATAAVQGDEAGAVVSLGACRQADRPVRIWAAHRVGMLEVVIPHWSVPCRQPTAARRSRCAHSLWTASRPVCRSGKSNSSQMAPWNGSAQANNFPRTSQSNREIGEQ